MKREEDEDGGGGGRQRDGKGPVRGKREEKRYVSL